MEVILWSFFIVGPLRLRSVAEAGHRAKLKKPLCRVKATERSRD